MLEHREATTRVRHAIRRKLEAGNLKGTHGESHMIPPWLNKSGFTPRSINLDATTHPHMNTKARIRETCHLIGRHDGGTSAG